MTNTVAIVQARMSSTRLPGKVLLPLGRRPVIGQVFHQLSFSRTLTRSLLATSVDASDDPLAEWARSASVECVRGRLDDVLDRFHRASMSARADVIVRITGDCPLIDPEIVDAAVQKFSDGGLDYLSNSLPPTFPDGMDVEVFTARALDLAWKNAGLSSEREHVTPYIRNHPELFKLGNLVNAENLESVRLTLDNPEDYKLLSAVCAKLEKNDRYVRMAEILELLRNDEQLTDINKHISRNEGYVASLKQDMKRTMDNRKKEE